MMTPYLRCILAPNAGPMTLDGTNTWLLGDPTRGPTVVVDPGPADDHHLELIMDACAGGISDILLTHWHHDHSDAAPALAQLAGCGVRAADPVFAVPDPRTGPSAMPDGTAITAPGAELTVIVTPGHTQDSLSFLLRGQDGACWLLTGDMVLGRGTTVIMHPDGNLGAYLRSLDRMERVVHDFGVAQILPGHGPRVASPGELLRSYRTHRLERLQQVREAVAAGARTAAEVAAVVYADVPDGVRQAAERSVAAQLDYLSEPGSE
ncbi:MAG TPA: MBL fold metallo-hydrolase [Propionibacteriaceae bacterium]|nr:MBL fold metallo-hydrolase [Propionibacteriaceae bacterium]